MPFSTTLTESGVSQRLILTIFSAALGMFQFGYNTGVINAPQAILQDFTAAIYESRTGHAPSEKLSTFLWSFTVAIFNIGGMIGGVLGGWISDRFGRRKGLAINTVSAVIGGLLMALGKPWRSFESLIVGRLVIGFSCGINTVLVPMYLSEIAPVKSRGALGTVAQLAVTVGILISQIFGLPQLLGTAAGWPYLLGLAIVPAFLQALLLVTCPESPRYLLISLSQEDESRKSLRMLRGGSYHDDEIEKELSEMRAEHAAQTEAKMSILELFRTRALWTPLVVAVVMHLSQQFSGINGVLYYSTSIFESAGIGHAAAQYATLIVGVIMVAMTIVSIPLMDRTGRRSLHLLGLSGMFVMSILLTVAMATNVNGAKWLAIIAVISTLIYVVFFAIGPGSIPWMITPELFTQGPRPAAMSLVTLVNWFSAFVVGLVYPLMQATLKNYSFLPFTALLALFVLFTFKKVPETKNRTIEEITSVFGRQQRESEQMQERHRQNLIEEKLGTPGI